METMNKEQNVKLQPNFYQVYVWPGTIVDSEEITEFEEWAKETFDIRIQFLETIITKPNRCESGTTVPGTGGRKDVFFAVHFEDVWKFAVPRFEYGIRYIEDATADINGYPSNPIYPERVLEYRSW